MATRVVLGITGGIAAYKAAELARLLKKSEVDVQVVMTEAGTRFITPVTMQALSGNPVYTDAWDGRIANNMAHIDLSRDADAILVAPASADFLAKLASGLADDLLSTLVLARQPTCPLFVAPAMNREMWENLATQRNIARLREDGVAILGPDIGDQACGENGMGRMLEPADLLAALSQAIGSTAKSQPLIGKRALVTAGPTFEPIDPVRGITNRSSGKMGYAIAQALKEAGAEVVLISGQTAMAPPAGVSVVHVQTASQMFDAVSDKLAGIDLFFAVAAVADYTPAAPNPQKIKKSADKMTVELMPTADILAWVAGQKNPPFCIGFAAESENIVENARKKLEKKRIPMIIANSANVAIGADHNEVTILDQTGDVHLGPASKLQIARQIVSHAARLYLDKNPVNVRSAPSSTFKFIKNA